MKFCSVLTTLFFLCFSSFLLSVETPEDQENLRYFKMQYEAGLKGALTMEAKSIPHTIHVIWLDDEKPSKEMISNITSWKKEHSSWTVKLWTSRKSPLSIPGVEQVTIRKLFDSPLLSCFSNLSHIAEKADLLRLAILYREGGVIVDPMLRCKKKLDSFHERYDFYAGLERTEKTILSSSIFVSRDLLAAKQGHPMIRACIDRIASQSLSLEGFYPGSDPAMVKTRIFFRTVTALNDVIKDYARPGLDIIFPNIQEIAKKYGDDPHLFLKPKHERKIEQKLRQIDRGISETNLVVILILFLNSLTFLFLILGMKVRYGIRQKTS